MKNLFNSIKLTKPKTNVFDLSHDVKLSCDMGKLIPTALIECIPGDKFNIGCESLIRMAPMVAPMMHNVNVYMHYWFVPNRILWPNWEEFITNSPNAETPPVAPYMTIFSNGSGYGSLHDYFGVPDPALNVGATSPINVSAFPVAAYNKIYNEMYRDQNLIPEIPWELVDGDNTGTMNVDVLNRAWEHDYFTAALPFAQKGDAVTIPMSGFDVPVRQRVPGGVPITLSGTPSNITVQDGVPDGGFSDELYAETSQFESSATINDLRRAFRLQEWLEKAARGGSRYFENILMFFGKRSPDKRLQRPEYITGTVSPMVISEVLNTTGTTDLPQGNMSGHGLSVTSGKYGFYECEEHGYIIGIMSIMPKTAYFQGLHRTWTKFDPMDYYWPPFANIGEQEVRNKEVYAYTDSDEETFGYVPRYAEYKFMNSRVAGDFKTTLKTWHMARDFGTLPALNGAFVSADPTTRIFAVEEGVQHLWCHVYHKIRAIRAMPKFGNPSF